MHMSGEDLLRGLPLLAAPPSADLLWHAPLLGDAGLGLGGGDRGAFGVADHIGGSAGSNPVGATIEHQHSTAADMYVGLTRFDGHPTSGVRPLGGCPSWRPWNPSSRGRVGRSRLSSRPRLWSCASRVTARSGRSPGTLT